MESSSIHCSIQEDDTVHAKLPDGLSMDIPIELLKMSNVFQDALATAGSEGDSSFSLTVPIGLLEAWLQAASNFAKTSQDFKGLTVSQLTLFILAADFFAADEHVLKCLFTELAHRLFRVSSSSKSISNTGATQLLGMNVSHSIFGAADVVDVDAASTEVNCEQVLRELPVPIAIAVLRTSQSPLSHMLHILPTHMHHLAVEAFFPSLSTHRTLELNWDDHPIPVLISTLQTAADSSIRSLSFTRAPSFKASCPDLLPALIQAILPPTHINLHFDSYSHEPTEALALCSALPCNTALTKLDIRSSSMPVLSHFFHAASQLPGLHSLTLEHSSCSFADSQSLQVPGPDCACTLLTHLRIGQVGTVTGQHDHYMRIMLEDPLHLARFLRSLNLLEVLELNVDDRDADLLSMAFSSSSTHTDPHHPPPDARAAELVLACSHLHHLSSLTFFSPMLAHTAAAAALTSIQAPLSNLTLFSRHYKSNTSAIAPIATLLQQQSTLHNVALYATENLAETLSPLVNALTAAGTTSSCKAATLLMHPRQRASLSTAWDLLTRLPSLEILKVVWGNCPSNGILCCSDPPVLASMRSSLSHLTYLAVEESCWSNVASVTPFMHSVLGSLTSLQHFEFTSCFDQRFDVVPQQSDREALMSAVTHLVRLRHFALHSAAPCFSSCNPLAPLSSLTFLHFFLESPPSSLHTQQLSASLKQLHQLRTLELFVNEGLVLLELRAALGALSSLSELRRLAVAGKAMGLAPTVIVPAIAMLTSLEHLVCEEAPHLAYRSDSEQMGRGEAVQQEHEPVIDPEGLRRLHKLQSLQLECKKMDSCACRLAEVLGGLECLNHVDLYFGCLDDEALQAVVKSLSSLSKLRHVYLGLQQRDRLEELKGQVLGELQ